MKEMMEKNVDPQLWHACAGGMVQMPQVNCKVFYFPQGHVEHTFATVDFLGLPRIPPLILCRVTAVMFLADPETDEVYVRIRLVPIGNNQGFYEIEEAKSVVDNGLESSVEKPASFAKILTQSDANNGGGFSVPRYCAETIFPRLDYTADPPVQTVVAKDVHGETWKFRHIYRGTPRRHLLTTGWSTFVNQKKLVAGDSIVFLRSENGDLCVGIRRSNRGGIGGGGGGPESPSGWNSSSGNHTRFSVFLKEDDKKSVGGSGGGLNGGRGRIRPECVVEAVKLAASGQPFEVKYYPRASTPEFIMKASSVNSAMRIQWCPGMRFKMPFETEDACRISWFMGTISSVQFADPVRWPNSPWRLLQVLWDEPDLLQNVTRVSPWLVELVSTMPVIHLSPFSPPRKKSRFPQNSDFSFDGQFPMPSFLGNPLGPCSTLYRLADNVAVGIQGARHAQLGVPLSDLHFSNNKLHFGLLSPSFNRLNPLAKTPDHSRREVSNDVSCLLTMGSPHEKKLEKTTPRFLLFGQPILTEQQMSKGCSGEPISRVAMKGSSSSFISLKTERSAFWNHGFHGNDTGHCKVFLESEDVGRTLDLSVLGSYDELYKRLGNMFGLERSDMESLVFYRDASGVLKRIGDEAFSIFIKTAKRLTISTSSGSNSNSGNGRKWMTGLPVVGRGLESSNSTGPLSIFA